MTESMVLAFDSARQPPTLITLSSVRHAGHCAEVINSGG